MLYRPVERKVFMGGEKVRPQGVGCQASELMCDLTADRRSATRTAQSLNAALLMRVELLQRLLHWQRWLGILEVTLAQQSCRRPQRRRQQQQQRHQQNEWQQQEQQQQTSEWKPHLYSDCLQALGVASPKRALNISTSLRRVSTSTRFCILLA
jgi:hypothetical protein